MAERPKDGRDKVCVAQIGAAHGLRGEVRMRIFTRDPAALARYGVLQTQDGRTLTLTNVRPAKDHFVARFRGVEDRDAAEALRNRELYVPRDRLPPPDEDEFYHADLVGLLAVRPDGTELGRVIAVHDFGAGDILEIRLAEKTETVMLPFTRAVVPEIDIAGGRITIDPPDGTLDRAAPDEAG